MTGASMHRSASGQVRHRRPTLRQWTGENTLHKGEQEDRGHQQAEQRKRRRPPGQWEDSLKDEEFSREADQPR